MNYKMNNSMTQNKITNFPVKIEDGTTVSIVKKKSNFKEFMKNHLICKDDEKKSTNTRIGDKTMDIYGGNYHIPEEEYQTFLDLYFQEVFVKKKMEYITEAQLEENGPILIDIDMRLPIETNDRLYNEDNVNDLIICYLDELKNMYQFDDNSKFQIYLLEKTNIRKIPEKNIVKDGIHIIIGIQSDHITQQMLRKNVIKKMEDKWENIPLQNTWEDVFDPCISTGKTNWQLYGSTKPGFEPYVLTKIFDIQYDTDDGEFIIKKIQLEKFSLKKELFKLSARCNTHPYFFYKNEYFIEREEFIKSSECVGKNTKKKTTVSSEISILNVKNKEQLDKCVNDFLDEMTQSSNYELKEAYEYTMTLPEQYYGTGSFSKWIRVGWALRNISDKLFIAWIAFSSQSNEFSYSDIPDLYEKWRTFDLQNTNGLTKRSIMYWSKTDAPTKYKEIRERSIDYYIEQTLQINKTDLSSESKLKPKGCGDFDLAVVLYHLFKDQFVCVSVKANIWYTYKNHRWVEIDSGTTLRKAISYELRDLYRKKASSILEHQVNEENEEKNKFLKIKSEKVLDICNRLAKTNDKKNIMTEAKELFFDDTFIQKLDTNPYLLCFNNGVFDFKEKVFRRGYPEDYISKTTNLDYHPINYEKDSSIIAEIKDFMNKLFPIKELNEYMWQHLASTLIGTSVNQTFNMYIGVGSNGKSVLISLMEKILGEYKGDVPLSLVTDKRTKIGGLAPEMVALKGVRYAVMQEPQKGDRINEGVMKQITSGIDPIQARAPYMLQPVTFIPQFKLVVCANVFMEIKSQDQGTWRRIRVVDFLSLFTDKPTKNDPDKPYQFLKEDNLIEKFDSWKEIFMSLLIEKALTTNGKVDDCDIVKKSSDSYRESQDFIAEFISDRVISDVNGSITKTELTAEFNCWYQGVYGSKGSPSLKDVQAYMNKQFGKYEKYKCWKGVRINYDRELISVPETDDENEDDDTTDPLHGNDIDINDL